MKKINTSKNFSCLDEKLLLKMEEGILDYNLEIVEDTLNKVKVLPGVWKLVVNNSNNIDLAIYYTKTKKFLYNQDYILQLKRVQFISIIVPQIFTI